MFPSGMIFELYMRDAYSYEKFIEAANMKNTELQNNVAKALLFDGRKL